MVRNDYWDKAREFLDWCNSEELKVLGMQANKELNKRINEYLNKVDADIDEEKRANMQNLKNKAIKRNMRK